MSILVCLKITQQLTISGPFVAVTRCVGVDLAASTVLFNFVAAKSPGSKHHGKTRCPILHRCEFSALRDQFLGHPEPRGEGLTVSGILK
jgi:hypothetical protein